MHPDNKSIISDWFYETTPLSISQERVQYKITPFPTDQQKPKCILEMYTLSMKIFTEKRNTK